MTNEAVIARMEMDAPNVGGLLEDIAVSYGLPALGFVMFSANRAFANRVRTKKEDFEKRLRRIAIVFLLLLFLAMFSALMLQDCPTLAYLFRNSPFLFSLISLLLVLATIALIAALFYSQLRPSLWKSDFRIESHSFDSDL
jgi:amino acid transporter